jgi:hypothetical protein
VVAGAGAGNVEQKAFGGIDLFEVGLVGDGFDAGGIEPGVENVTLATLVAIDDALGVPPGLLLCKATLPPLRPGRPRTRPSAKPSLKR